MPLQPLMLLDLDHHVRPRVLLLLCNGNKVSRNEAKAASHHTATPLQNSEKSEKLQPAYKSTSPPIILVEMSQGFPEFPVNHKNSNLIPGLSALSFTSVGRPLLELDALVFFFWNTLTVLRAR